MRGRSRQSAHSYEVDRNQLGDEANPEYRSRLVAQQLHVQFQEKNMFAALLPLEVPKLASSMAVTEGIGRNRWRGVREDSSWDPSIVQRAEVCAK
eukprot:360500-Pyramimonas_sp.AAC.1